MAIVLSEQLSETSPAALRLAEASFVLERFSDATRAKHDETRFLLTTYFDAFLFCYVSIEEMVEDSQVRCQIQAVPIFSFFKALRNIATHHCVLSGVKGKFPPPVTRIVKIGGPENAVLCVMPEKVEFIFSEILKIRPGEKKTINKARAFLSGRVTHGGDILVHELMSESLASVQNYVA